LLPYKFNDDILNGSRVIALTNKQKKTHTPRNGHYRKQPISLYAVANLQCTVYLFGAFGDLCLEYFVYRIFSDSWKYYMLMWHANLTKTGFSDTFQYDLSRNQSNLLFMLGLLFGAWYRGARSYRLQVYPTICYRDYPAVAYIIIIIIIIFFFNTIFNTSYNWCDQYLSALNIYYYYYYKRKI